MRYCGHCGGERDRSAAEGGHTGCDQRLQLEPPRFCTSCRRRMVVQVTPASWSARCTVHGETSASTWR